MNFKLTFALVILLLAVSAGFFYYSNHKPADSTETKTKTVINPEPKDIIEVTLRKGNDVQVSFAKLEEKWSLQSPIKAAVEGWQVDSVASGLKTMTYDEKFPADATGAHSLDETGLTTPRYNIEFRDLGNKIYKIFLGKRTPGGMIYARLDGDTTNTIYVLKNNPLTALDKEPQEFRSKDLVAVAAEKVTGLIVEHPNQKLELSKASGKWLVTAPVPTRGAAQAIEDLLNAFKDTRIADFSPVKRADKESGLAKPRLSVSVIETEPSATPAPATGPGTAPATAPAKTTTITLDFGPPTDFTKKYVYASLRGSDEAVKVEVAAFDKLNKELKDLRDAAITPAPVADATGVEIQNSAGTTTMPAQLSLNKDGGGWKLAAGGMNLAADTNAVSEFLGQIRDLRANKYVDGAGDLKSIGLDPPKRTITLTVPGQSQREVILIGAPETATALTPVQRQGEATVFMVQTADLAKLSPGVLDLRGRNITTWRPEEIQSIEISGAGVKMPATLTREAKGWKVAADGKTFDAEDTKITPLLADFDPLFAQKWAAMTPPSGTPAVHVKLTVTQMPEMAASQPATQASTQASTQAGTQAGTQPASAPATQQATPAMMGPVLPVTREIILYQAADKTWTAVAPGVNEPVWAFVPTATLAEHLQMDYRPASATQAATQSATQAGSQPATASAPAP